MIIVTPVIDAVVPERDIADGRIKLVVIIFGFFISFDLDVRIRI